MKITYTDGAVADIVDPITYPNERNRTAAAKLEAGIARCIQRLADREFEGPVLRLRSGAIVRSLGVATEELLIISRLPPEARANRTLAAI